MSNRSRLTATAVTAALALATAPPSRAALQLAPMITGLNAGSFTNDAPIAFVDPDDGLPHRLVVMHNGRVMVWDTSGVRATPFLDLSVETGSGKVLKSGASSERGLLALAVHPDFRDNGLFYVYYTSTDWDTGGPIANGDIVVERYTRSLADPNLTDPASAQVVLRIPHSASNHNGGWLAFGPADGLLYVSTGDGGGGCDSTGPAAGVGSDPLMPPGNAWRYDGSHYNPPASHPGRYLLGKILRLDVAGDDFPADALRNYAIPPTNPYAGATFGADEIWARGLRNPFRFSFDRENGDLWLGDVGQSRGEEINFLPAGSPAAQNFGWVCREGLETSSLSPSSCTTTNCPADTTGLLQPIRAEDGNGGGWCSIMGGYRYRGAQIPALGGVYFYSDYCVGDVWKATPSGISSWTFALAVDASFGTYAFAQDHLGELYLVNGAGGTVSCFDDGEVPGSPCFWRLWPGFGEDGFESGNLTRWHAQAP
jgi:glucose/arabinose dehydrogenase